jgi:hypothetical protein
MLRNLFAILFRPGKTLDRLLENRSYKQSWGATWFLIGINALFLFFTGLYFFRFVTQLIAFDPMSDDVSGGLLAMFFGLGLFGGILGLIVYYVLSRFFFSWIVRLGLRISASGDYPQDPQERRERGRLLRMVHPYTQWIVTLPSLLLAAVFLLLFDVDMLLEAIDPITGEIYEDSGMFLTFMSWMVGYVFFLILMFAAYVYMIIVRVMAVKRIYSISGTQAFWGPFLIFFLIYFVVYAVYFGLVFLSLFFPEVGFVNEI